MNVKNPKYVFKNSIIIRLIFYASYNINRIKVKNGCFAKTNKAKIMICKILLTISNK